MAWRIGVCVKHSPQRVTVNPLTGATEVDLRDVSMSPADEAALELALQLGSEVLVATAGPPEARAGLDVAAGVGARQLVLCPARSDASSASVAAALATALADVDLVFCGDYSTDRGSGSVPALLAAELGWPQAMGVVALRETEAPGPKGGDALLVERRLDRGRREQLLLAGKAVVSVEGSVARLRRASLAGMLTASASAPITPGPDAVEPEHNSAIQELAIRVHRPRVLARPGPDPTASPIDRVRQVTDAAGSRTPPRTLHLDPPEAAREILAQLSVWGYLEATSPDGDGDG